MNEMQIRQPENNEWGLPQKPLPIIPRKQALAEFEAILPLDAPERVLNVHGGGGRGKTWFLWSLQRYCEKKGLLYNIQPIDFYDTAHQRAFGVMDAIVQALDPKGEYFKAYLESGLVREREQRIFLQCLQDLAQDYCKDGQRGIVLMFDTYEVVREGRAGRWLLGAFLEAANDIAVVISGRSKIIAAETNAPIRFCEPGNFSILEIADYIRETFARCEVPLTQDDIKQIAERIHQYSDGIPVVVSLTLDVVNLYVSSSGILLDVGGVLSILEDARRKGDFETGLIEKVVELLGTRPEQQWALLYMAHLRRRFNEDIYGFLQGKSADVPSADLDPFALFYIVKYRQLDEQETSVLLHDLIRERIHGRYWQGAIPTQMVLRGRQEGLFPPDLDELWTPYCDPEKEVPQIGASELKQILRWLNDKIIAYCEEWQARLKAEQDALDRETEFLKWEARERRRQALSAEQLLYELDRDLEEGWRHFRRDYKDAFEAYRQGYCEQLELTILNAWSEQELSPNAPLGPRRAEIQEMVRVRQIWWKIRFGLEARKQGIGQLQTLRQEIKKRPEGECQELLADTMGALGWAYALEGDIAHSIICREEAATLYEKVGLLEERGWALNFLGESHARQGDFQRADCLWEEAIEIAQRQKPPDEEEIASIMMKRARYKNLSGELGLALGYSKIAEALFRKVGDMRRLGSTLNFQGRIYLANERFRHAKEAFHNAQNLLSKYGDPEDEALLQIGWGEFYRRRAGEMDLKSAHEHLDRAVRIAASTGYEEWKATAQGELGALFRDEAHELMLKSQPDAARHAWKKAKEHLEEALGWARQNQTWFLVADFLSDLCDLCFNQYQFGMDIRGELESYLDQLEEVAHKHNFARYFYRVAELRADLYYDKREYRKAAEHYLLACEASGLHTHASHEFRRSYDSLVGKLEKQLSKLPLKDRATLAEWAIRWWAQREQAGKHPQLVLACQRMLYPAQARLEEEAAEATFAEGQEADKVGEREIAKQHYDEAFHLYVQACYHYGLLTAASYENYAAYIALVDRLERRLYDLERPEDILYYSKYVEAEWYNLGQAIAHSSVLEVCQRAREMSRLLVEGTS
jgi:hypothetical protein